MERHVYVTSDSARHRYYIDYDYDDGDVVVLTPAARSGSPARSDVEAHDYRYTHGGTVYQAAVDRAHTIAVAEGLAS